MSKRTIEIPLTRGMVAIIDESDFRSVAQRKWRAQESSDRYMGKVTKRRYYAATTIKKKTILLHRFLLESDAAAVDHINGNTLDNRRANIRNSTVSHNISNQPAKSRSGFKGVYLVRSRWKSYIHFQNRRINVGSFSTAQEAVVAYDAALIRLRGDFACTNSSQPPAQQGSGQMPAGGLFV